MRKDEVDRLDAMAAFVLTVDQGSLSGAARKLGRSPAAVTRAMASLEERLGAQRLPLRDPRASPRRPRRSRRATRTEDEPTPTIGQSR
jgi:DNA-binding transcriptional LysR family regulator